MKKLKTTLYLKLGTRVASVVAHYEHIPSNLGGNARTNISLPALGDPVYGNINSGTSSQKAKLDSVKEAIILECHESIYEQIDPSSNRNK